MIHFRLRNWLDLPDRVLEFTNMMLATLETRACLLSSIAQLLDLDAGIESVQSKTMSAFKNHLFHQCQVLEYFVSISVMLCKLRLQRLQHRRKRPQISSGFHIVSASIDNTLASDL